MTTYSPLFGSSAVATAIAIAVILLASNFTVINAQQPQQLTNQPGVFESGTPVATTIFQSTNDSFRIQVPDGWLAHDLNNTGAALQDEITRGYGLLAQVCPEGEQQQAGAAALPNASGTPTCQTAENNVIHIIRYPNLDTTLSANTTANTTIATNNMTIDSVLEYHLQKLQEVGYNNIQVVNNTDSIINLINPQSGQTLTNESAKFVEMTYTTASAPDETRTGYFLLTYTDATAPLSNANATSANLGTTKGYAVFYEGNSTENNAATGTTTAAAGGLAPTPLQTTVAQVFDSFELMVAPEVAQAIAQQATQPAETTEEAAAVEEEEEEATDEEEEATDEEEEATDEEEEEEGGDDDDGGNGGDDDDGGNGGDDDDDNNGGSLEDCIIMGGGNIIDDCDLTTDDGGDGGDEDGA
jgi:hypothetical protein